MNILLLVGFKYLDFIINNINVLFSLNIPLCNLPLPLAISFFTFQQIGFIVKSHKEQYTLPEFVEYANYITFYPQLIAGPIVDHKDYLPQLKNSKTYLFSIRNMSIGFVIFSLGLFKKTTLADNAGKIADLIFQLVHENVQPNFIEAWLGIFSYSFQIYFDFSGYSDMAIGLARMFNIYLPCNFLSPYKATSMIDFWRRWHMSLSNFLKEYVYIPLGGNRKGSLSRYKNLLITMLIGGLWHGASWNFVIWGGLHGIYLVINHLLRAQQNLITLRWSFLKRCFIFTLVSLTWIFFRADTFQDALLLLQSAIDFRQITIPHRFVDSFQAIGINLASIQGKFHLKFDNLFDALTLTPFLFIISFYFPNIYEWTAYFRPAKDFIKNSTLRSRWFKRICWKPTIAWSIMILLIFIIAFGNINNENEFIYFRF